MNQLLDWGERQGEENKSGYFFVSEISFFFMLSFFTSQLGKRGPEKMHYLLNAWLEYCCSQWLLMSLRQTGISY